MSRIVETPTGDLALTFDDVLLQPGHSTVLPADVLKAMAAAAASANRGGAAAPVAAPAPATKPAPAAPAAPEKAE